jgi:Zn-dependent M28 family amino/carboxypeptidase
LSYNVIGQITGKKNKNQILLVGAHLDSWDLGEGAHDDGAGVVQSMEVLRLLKINNYQPLNTVRVVLFMNEENGLRGAKKYSEVSNKNNDSHLLAIESDAGGFSPRGFSIDTNDENFIKINKWKNYFQPYKIHDFERGESGADIAFLKNKTNTLIGLRPDSQRYFEYHHSANDTFEAINKRELELGAASMVSLIYLADYFGL